MLNQLHQDGVRGGYTVINEEMDIIAGAVFRVNVEVLQGGLESPDAKVSNIKLNEKDLGGCNPTGSNFSCSFQTCNFKGDKNEIISLTGKLNIVLRFTHAAHYCDCDEITWECSPKQRRDESGDVAGRTGFIAVARVTLTPIRSTKGNIITF